MYPNPQDALPLPPHPSVEQYKKLAKDLVKSCRSGDPAAIGAWALRWIEALATHQTEPDAQRDGMEIDAARIRSTNSRERSCQAVARNLLQGACWPMRNS